MILSSLCATSGIIVGILAFAQQPTFTRLSRPFSAGIMFFASSEWMLLPLARRYSGSVCNPSRSPPATSPCHYRLPPLSTPPPP